MEKAFKTLTEFESQADADLFIKIFGEVGKHLWNKFANKNGFNLIRFGRSLDTENHQRLMNHLSQK
jgi:hypothetical protein